MGLSGLYKNLFIFIDSRIHYKNKHGFRVIFEVTVDPELIFIICRLFSIATQLLYLSCLP